MTVFTPSTHQRHLPINAINGMARKRDALRATGVSS
jgi:hypothetical protein